MRKHLKKVFAEEGCNTPVQIAEKTGKDRESIVRMFSEKKDYCPGIFYLYEMSDESGIDINRFTAFIPKPQK